MKEKEYVLRVKNLSKSYRGSKVLQQVSIDLEPGKIYGLIGQNGAGKTTLMRLITGIAFPEEGMIELFGQEGGSLLEERKRIGAMIEYPSIIPYMSAGENIRYYQTLRGIPGTGLEEELLKLVGLRDTGEKPARNFSLGMKQRLGIAIALIGNPDFLILDEPINGLDPLGVIEIRELVRRLCEERLMTVLISSHNLPELYQTATDYIIIHKGKLLRTITHMEMEENCKHHILIECLEPERLAQVLEMRLHTNQYKVMPDKSVRLYDYLDEKVTVAKVLFEEGVIVTNFSVQGDTLEDYFISLVGGKEND